MRRTVDIVVLFSLMVSVLLLSASAQSQNTFYLHASYLLDQNAPTGTTANALKLATGEYYVWKSASFSAQLSFPAGTWTAAVWMNMTRGPTQYRLKLGTVNIYGGFAEYAHSFTPIITSASPTWYEVSISVGVLNVPAGESLAIGFLGQWQNESYSPPAYILFDSQTTPSSLTGPVVVTTITTTSTATQATTHETTTTTQHTATTQTATQQTTTQTTTQHTTTHTTTQQMTTATTESTTTMAAVGSSPGMGWAFALIGIGIGVACAGGGVAAALTGRQYPQVFTYDGYYYCMKHRVPVWYVQGHLWCPVEQRYLRS